MPYGQVLLDWRQPCTYRETNVLLVLTLKEMRTIFTDNSHYRYIVNLLTEMLRMFV